MRKLIQSLTFLVVMIGGTLFFSMESEAKEIIVKTPDELNEAISNMKDDTEIKLHNDFVNTKYEAFGFKYYLPYKITIDCNNINLLYTFGISNTGDGDVTIKNYRSVGNNTDKHNSVFEIINFGSDSKVLIKDSLIKNHKYTKYSPFVLWSTYGNIEFDNVTIKNIKTDVSPAIFNNSIDSFLKIKNSTFQYIETNAGPPVIHNSTGHGSIEIKNSKFSNNRSNNELSEYVKNSAGVIMNDYSDNKDFISIIKDSYFENNTVASNAEQKRPAGAIGLRNNVFNEKIIITGNTFNNNKGINGGGAVVIHEDIPSDTVFKLENNTFYKNKSTAYDNKYINGGAVLLYTEKQGKEIIETELNSKNNTYYGNQLIRSDEVDADVQGAAVGVENTYVTHEMSNSLYVGNELVNNKQTSKNFENIYVSNEKFLQSHNLGFDNGEASKDTVKDAYGKYPVVLGDNGGKVKVGSKEDAINIPTIMIAPKLTNNNGTIYAGLANMTGSDATEIDQRGYTRKGKPDIGAVEISSIVYDSNGGKFSLAELKKYDGKTYYEGANADQYAKVGAPDVAFTIIDGKKVLKPTKANYDFIGWTDKKTDKFVKAKYNTGKKVMVDDQIVLYAVWKKKSYSLKYFNNGKTTGTIPTQKNVTPNTSVTIKSAGKLKRKGYKFSGWSTKPSAKKGEAAYAPGKKLKLVKNTKLYAIWNR